MKQVISSSFSKGWKLLAPLMAPCRCMTVCGNLVQPQHTAFQPGWQSKAACMRQEAWTGCRTPFTGSAAAAMESPQSYWRRYIRFGFFLLFFQALTNRKCATRVTKIRVLLKPVCAAANECVTTYVPLDTTRPQLPESLHQVCCYAHHGLGQVVSKPRASGFAFILAAQRFLVSLRSRSSPYYHFMKPIHTQLRPNTNSIAPVHQAKLDPT